MRESFGTAFVVNAVIIFVAIFIFFFVAGMSYTKGFKVKNRIVDIIEKNGCFQDHGSCTSKDDIDKVLGQAGYRIKEGVSDCDKIPRIRQQIENKGAEVLTTDSSTYRYCVYRVKVGNRGYYYGAVAFIYFDFPLNLGTVEFPVFGETKIIEDY